ncbi:DNA-3-methyladenine glycosylase 2 family protein [Paenibacillus sp. GYB003]|uniref:DNA-3-methyladenine glycosylase 2 family protein n=1 Tax=Paenibacillus sp. GYB003 TaxID=2994392 RepID=UPI002F963A73
MDEDLWNTILTRDRKYDGIYYLGIKTTGIYCRPSCRSRLPKRENVSVYRSAEEARRAGYRACKRCKPDNPGPDGPDAELAAQVKAAIARRLPQAPTLAQLAAETGVSPFHLQRTFKRVTGTTPAAFALGAKLELGRGLLERTAEPAGQIAVKAGFRSPSHFSAAFQKAFGLTPTEYRNAGDRSVAARPAESNRPTRPAPVRIGAGPLTVDTPEPFDFRQALAYLGRSPLECMYRIEGDRVVQAARLEGETVVLDVGAESPGRLQIRIADRYGRPHEADRSMREAAVRRVREWFDLDTDIRPFYALAERDPVLRRLTRDYAGFRLVRIPDLFEALCWAVIGQQITLSFAYKLKRSFVETFGTSVEHRGGPLWLFPSPERVAEASPDRLADLQFSRQKAAYILEIARLMAAGELTKDMLQRLPDRDAVCARLTAIKGIGPWTAHYVLLRCLGDPSAFPVRDAGIHQAVRRLWRLPHKPTVQELQDRFAAWSPWNGYVTFYMWRSLQDD